MQLRDICSVLFVATRSLSSQEAGRLKDKVMSVFMRLSAKLDGGMSGPEGEEFLLRTLSQELSTVTTADIITGLQQMVVAEGTPYREYLSEVRALVQSVACIGGGGDVPDSTIQLAVAARAKDQFSILVGPVFKGRRDLRVPYANVDELMRELGEFEDVKAGAGKAERFSKQNVGGGGRWFGRVVWEREGVGEQAGFVWRVWSNFSLGGLCGGNTGGGIQASDTGSGAGEDVL